MPELQHIHGGNLTRAAARYGIPVTRLIDFSANINPLGPSPHAIRAVAEALDQVRHYPDPDCTELRAALSAYLGTREERILMGNGAAELIYLLVRVLGCRRAIIPTPTFCEYALAVLSCGGAVEKVPMPEEEDFCLPVEKINKMLPGADILFICNPNNPTGWVVEAGPLVEILDQAEKAGVTVVVDEAFMDFVPERERCSLVSSAGARPNLVVLYSLTKFFGIPGLRLGAMLAPPGLNARLTSAKDPWNVNTLAQAAGIAGLRDVDYMEATRKLVAEERHFLFDGLVSLKGVKPLPGAANFLLVRVSETGISSGQLADLLGRRGILARDCAGFTGLAGRYLRLAVKTRPENEKLLTALQEILEVLSSYRIAKY